MTSEDYIAGTLGNKNRGTTIGKDIRQEDHRQHFDFDFRRSNDDVEDNNMGEISRLIREFYRQIALLEYRLAEQEKKFNIAALFFGAALLLILLKLFVWGV